MLLMTLLLPVAVLGLLLALGRYEEVLLHAKPRGTDAPRPRRRHRG
jgi:hypothetical protein